MKHKLFWFLGLLTLTIFNSCIKKTSQLTDFVDPFIGTGGHGHTYPGASLPFGMMQLSPDTRLTGWDGCSGYHYSDSVIYGFSHTHLSGTGVSDYGDILLMPTSGKAYFNNGADLNPGYSSRFQKEKENARPGFYHVYLDDNKVDVELTCSKRVGFHKYTFDSDGFNYVILDLNHRDFVIDSKIKVLDATRIEGYRISRAWAKEQRIYFAIEFSQPPAIVELAKNDIILDNYKELEGRNLKAKIQFHKTKNIYIKVAISAISEEQALENLEAEIPDWDFEKVKNEANETWNKELGKILVEGGTLEERKTFYTALYHSMLNPNLFMDVNGQYLGRDMKAHSAEGFDYYTVFSLWDTYRAEHPLLTIIDQKRTKDFIQTFLKQYDQGGKLPVWEFAANETECMIGYHSIPVIVDAYLKGINDFDSEKTFEAMKYSAELDQYGLDAYRKYGYIPGDKEHESVSKTLEYAYDDWCIAQMAKKLGKDNDYETFMKRSQYFKNILDFNNFMRPKMNGSWLTPFDPKEVNNQYTEANSWQYSFYAPQDIPYLIERLGGNEKFVERLDQLFSENSQTTGRDQADITGLIGQYAHGNEPSHHIAYLYNYANAAWKTQQMARKIMNKMYTCHPDGLCGNEDCGQMSAWYVLSAMGFYPVTPCSNTYEIGSPIFDKVTISLENGKKFIIKAKNVSDENIYIQSATMNGESYDYSFLQHQNIMDGGELVFKMGDKPNKDWGLRKEQMTYFDDFTLSPVFKFAKQTFYDSLEIGFENPLDGADIYFSTDGDSFQLYQKPFYIYKTTHFKAYAVKNKVKSFMQPADYYLIPKGRSIEILSKYNSQYTAGGDDGLIDMLRGTVNWRLGYWQGYQSQDFEAIIDLGKVQSINKISTGFLQDVRSWIVFPTEVKYSYSNDKINFHDLKPISNNLPDSSYVVEIKNVEQSFSSPIKARYIKVEAKNYGKLPYWHLGAGGDAFIFVDEVIVE